MDASNFNLGKYISIAVNNPKKYPRKPFLYKPKLKKMTLEEMEKNAKRNTKLLGGTIKNGNEN